MVKRKKKWLLTACVILVCAFLVGCGSSGKKEGSGTSTKDESTSSSATGHIYDDAEVKDVMNGVRTEKLGEYSIIHIDSSKLTDDVLADWYFNYVEKNDFNWCMILYTDKDDNSGVYAIKGVVTKDTCFDKDEYGDYSVGSSSDEITYIPNDDDQTLKVLE